MVLKSLLKVAVAAGEAITKALARSVKQEINGNIF